jgi:hypothetical protein
MAIKRSSVVSLSSLSRSIDKAVVLAGKRHGVQIGGENIIYNWEILGRILRELNRVDASEPVDIARTIAASAGLKGTPVATKIGRDILVGVIPRDLNVRF